MYPQQTELKSEKTHCNVAERPSSPLTVNVSQIRKRQNKCEMNKNSNEKGPAPFEFSLFKNGRSEGFSRILFA